MKPPSSGRPDGSRAPARRTAGASRAIEAPDQRAVLRPEAGPRSEPREARVRDEDAPRARLNAEWHARHPMPRGATIPQRIQWHLDHERHCGCRPMPLKLRALMARGTKPSREPWRGPGKPREE
jgi:hypothetical protein